MMILTFVIAYLVGYLVSARHLYVLFDEQSGGTPKRGEINDKAWAALVSIIWPAVLLFGLIQILLDLAIFRETPRQKAAREIAERLAERLATEKVAKQFDLSMPDAEARGLELGAFQVQVDIETPY